MSDFLLKKKLTIYWKFNY